MNKMYCCKYGEVQELEVKRQTEKLIIVSDGFSQRNLRKGELPKVRSYATEIIVYATNKKEAIDLYKKEMNKLVTEYEDILQELNLHLDKISKVE